MPAISCPKCRAAMEFDASIAGRAVACPKCGQQFTLPQIAAPVAVASISPAITPSFHSTVARRFKKPSSAWDFLDFKFEKYLTPWIIRITWVMSCGMAVVLLLVLLVTFATNSAASDESAPIEVPAGDTFDYKLPSRTTFATDATVRLTAFCVCVFLLILGLLWLRVVLETLIVVFNIATSVASIDEKTKPH
jgi:predicted nucleic-acid-binding Zn-ribbon protein